MIPKFSFSFKNRRSSFQINQYYKSFLRKILEIKTGIFELVFFITSDLKNQPTGTYVIVLFINSDLQSRYNMYFVYHL